MLVPPEPIDPAIQDVIDHGYRACPRCGAKNQVINATTFEGRTLTTAICTECGDSWTVTPTTFDPDAEWIDEETAPEDHTLTDYADQLGNVLDLIDEIGARVLFSNVVARAQTARAAVADLRDYLTHLDKLIENGGLD